MSEKKNVVVAVHSKYKYKHLSVATCRIDDVIVSYVIVHVVTCRIDDVIASYVICVLQTQERNSQLGKKLLPIMIQQIH